LKPPVSNKNSDPHLSTKNALYHPLRPDQIEKLRQQGCSAQDWAAIQVTDGFQPERVWSTHFSGTVRIGALDKQISFFGGIQEPAGIHHAKIHNCVIGDNVYISNIENYIANYIIEDEAVIRHTSLLAVEGETSFGNGTCARVINEAGGREVPIYDHLTAQIAYLLALYRDRTQTIQALQQMIEQYVRSVTSNMGLIAREARLIDCWTIKNVKVGPAAVIEGANRLENGTINSTPADPARIGTGVIAQDFIVSEGAQINDNTIIEKCFVGQSTHLGRQYSADNSIFFANCVGYHGEACSIFAGPFTVTYHKSTLLIAGLYSFLNAGSGSNQSNHMYKLGPVHQGLIERGSKTTSDSYLLWPARIGPFTLVMGRHYGNCDTSDLPYSYLIESEDESVLIPGVNLRSVGTVRDARKWPQRDMRKTNNKLDLITLNHLTPYTVKKMINGEKLLKNLRQRSGDNTRFYYYNSVKIKRSSLENGIKYYQLGIKRYLGNCLIQRLRTLETLDLRSIQSALAGKTNAGTGDWLDLAGLIVPQELIESLLEQIDSGKIENLEQLRSQFQEFYDNFLSYEWAWVGQVFKDYLQVDLSEITPAELIQQVKNWIKVVEELDRLRCRDARKEFDVSSRIGYGLDGDDQVRDRDFASVMGKAEDNDFILDLKQRLTRKQTTAKELIQRLEKLSLQA